ncbi:MAG: hypothetical protein CMH64_03655 [Nanoarchaeota archaeon]|nr:hypothetical protein [Nanoarchaeota archaeon]|tara:strand:+ start:809 stop:1039 length:231 start_codon:yes stop_codon:yes gene_type:complete
MNGNVKGAVVGRSRDGRNGYDATIYYKSGRPTRGEDIGINRIRNYFLSREVSLDRITINGDRMKSKERRNLEKELS